MSYDVIGLARVFPWKWNDVIGATLLMSFCPTFLLWWSLGKCPHEIGLAGVVRKQALDMDLYINNALIFHYILVNLCTCLAMPSRKKVELLTFLLVFGSCENAVLNLGHILKCFQAPSIRSYRCCHKYLKSLFNIGWYFPTTFLPYFWLRISFKTTLVVKKD